MIFALAAVLAGTTVGQQKDWAQWRGPERNGHNTEGVALLDRFEKLEPIWHSEPVLGWAEGGYATPVVAAGRVYIPFTTSTTLPIKLELKNDVLDTIGAVPEGVRRGAAGKTRRRAQVAGGNQGRSRA